MKKIEFYRHNIGEEDIRKAGEVLRSLFLTTGPVTSEFEEKFSCFTELRETVALNSCTAALHLSLLALGIGPGDEVITAPMTFAATVTSILHAGAVPVLVDVEPGTGLIDAALIEKAITPRTKAVVPVHLYGVMADMKAIRRIADRHGLAIVEDCAHCIEGERDGVRPGHLGDAACFSFYATKNLTSGEGGAVGTRDPELAGKVRIFRLHGLTSDAITRHSGKFRQYDMEVLGWKYNMDSIHSALLVGQIDRLSGYWERREAIARKYEKELGGVPGIRVPEVKGKSARHLQTVWVDAKVRDRVVEKLEEKGIGVSVSYRALHTLKYFRETFGYRPEDFPVALEIGLRTLTLPLYPKLTDEEAEYVIASLKEIVAGCQ